MAERPELLGLATEIVSAHVQQQRHCSRSATGADPAGLQRACYRRTNDCCTAETGVCGHRKAIGDCGSHRLPRLRQALLNAEAAPDDRPQADT